MDNHSQSQAHKLLTNFLLSRPIHRPSQNNDIIPPPPAYSFHPPSTQPTTEIEDDSFSLSEDEEDTDSEPLSPLTIHISTPLTITGNSNLILLPPSSTQNTSLTSTTTASATSIAISVLRALKNAGEGGVPMIDENGRLRPVRVEIEAGVRVEGRGNVVGFGLRRGVGENGRREENVGKEGLMGRGRDVVSNGNGQERKRRASSVPVGERDEKRGRMIS